MGELTADKNHLQREAAKEETKTQEREFRDENSSRA